jgi:hypothetical protein
MTDHEGSEFQPLTNDNFGALSDFLDHAEGLATAHIKKKIKDIPKVVLPINRVPEASLLFDSNDLIPPPKLVEKELEKELEKEKEEGGNIDSDVKGDVKGEKKKKSSNKKTKEGCSQPLSLRRFVTKKRSQKGPVKKGSVIASSDLDPEQENKKYDVEDNVLMHPKRNYIDKVPDLKSTNYKDIDTRFKLRQQHIQDLIDKKGSIT